MITCRLCDSEEYSVEYVGPIRDGEYGNETKQNVEVVKCSGCGLVRLKENPLPENYYESNEYRESYNSSADPADYINMHDIEQAPRVNKIGIKPFRNKNVLDYGCGGGSFLDHVKGVASTTYGIEPFTGFHNSLGKRGHKIFSNGDAALDACKGEIDTIVSFGVLEHVDNPFAYLNTAYGLLKDGGKMYLETDNLNDFLMVLGINEFERFFYRTAHLWYFNAETLTGLVEKCGFANIQISYRHNFDLSNTLMWLKDRRPTGNGKLDLFDNRLNDTWRAFLNEKGFSDLVCVEMSKG